MGGRVECKSSLTPFPLKAEWLEFAEWLCCKSAVSEPQVAETELYRCPLLQCSALGQAAGSQVLLPPGRVWEYSPEYPQDSGAGGICAGFPGALHWELLLASPDLCATAPERAELLLPQLPLCVGHTSVPRGWIRHVELGQDLKEELFPAPCPKLGVEKAALSELCNVLANLGCCCERGLCNFPERMMPDESNANAVLLNLAFHPNVQIYFNFFLFLC